MSDVKSLVMLMVVAVLALIVPVAGDVLRFKSYKTGQSSLLLILHDDDDDDDDDDDNDDVLLCVCLGGYISIMFIPEPVL